MALLSVKVTAASSVAGTQVGSAQVRSANVTVAATIGLVLTGGVRGLTGPAGPPGVGATWRGTWSSGTTYASGDAVGRLGVNYISVTAGNVNHDPSTDTTFTNWSPLTPGTFTPTWGVAQTFNARTAEVVSVMDNFSAAERADAVAYTGSIDTTAKVQAIVDYLTARGGGTIEVGYGKYLWNNLILKTGVSIAYEGYRGETGRTTATLMPCVIVGTTGPWVIDTPAGATFGCNVIGLSIQGPGAGTSVGGIRMQNVTRGSVVGCFVNNFAEWGILHAAGFACYFFGNVGFNCLLDRTRAIDKTTLPHGAIEIRGNDCWEMCGEYTTSQTGAFGAAVVTGTAQTGGAATIQLAAGESAVDSTYNGYMVEITGGTGVGQINYCTAYVGATKTCTLLSNWATVPDATSTYSLAPHRCFAGVFKGTDTWLSNGIYELSEGGVWIANAAGNPPVHCNGLSVDQNSGHGLVITSRAGVAPGCSSQRNSKAVDGAYDDCLILGGGGGSIIDGLITGSISGDTNQPRYGIHDACAGSNIADGNRSIIVNTPTTGLRRSKVIRLEASPAGKQARVKLAPGRQTNLTANSATPSFEGWEHWRLAYTIPVNVTAFLDTIEDCEYVVSSSNANPTIVNGASIKTASGANVTMSATSVLRFRNIGGIAYQC